MIGLTKRHRDLLAYVTGYVAAKGYSPSLSEIASGIGSVSKASVHPMLKRLAERGVIKHAYGTRRAIEIIYPIAIPRAPDGAPLMFIPVHDGGVTA
jgi:SOS-response transcriptional repressor LexA